MNYLGYIIREVVKLIKIRSYHAKPTVLCYTTLYDLIMRKKPCQEEEVRMDRRNTVRKTAESN